MYYLRRRKMKNVLPLLCLVILLVASGCGGTASGGGWRPYPGGPRGKAPLGLNYKCRDTRPTLSSNLTLPAVGCDQVTEGGLGDLYYANEGILGGGNITLFAE